MMSSSIVTFIGQVGFQVIQMVLYKQDKAVVGISLLINLPILIFALCTLQICITWAGFMFADAEILRNGNEQLLDDLEEGLIILEENKLTELYHNEAVKILS